MNTVVVVVVFVVASQQTFDLLGCTPKDVQMMCNVQIYQNATPSKVLFYRYFAMGSLKSSPSYATHMPLGKPTNIFPGSLTINLSSFSTQHAQRCVPARSVVTQGFSIQKIM